MGCRFAASLLCFRNSFKSIYEYVFMYGEKKGRLFLRTFPCSLIIII